MKTSEEQAEAKRLEREQKLKLYQSATQAVFQKVGPSEVVPIPSYNTETKNLTLESNCRDLNLDSVCCSCIALGKSLKLSSICSSVKWS